MTTKMWVDLAIAILPVIGIILTYVFKKRRKGGKASMPKNHTEQGSSTGGVSVSASAGSTVNINSISTLSSDKSSDSISPSDSCSPTSEANLNMEYESIKLNQVYTSLFAEEHRLKTEKIVIEEQLPNNRIKGYVELKEKDAQGNITSTLSYTLSGLFANKVLTAEYYSKGNRSDERGAINLKLIGQGILSGFCSFSKLSAQFEDDIRVSPYVWVAGDNVDLIDGTYDFCTQCYKDKAVCCCASEEIDMPFFLESEADSIRSQLDKRQRVQSYYSTSLPDPYHETNIRQIKRSTPKSYQPDHKSRCHFFDYTAKKCRIYEGRPIDCRLFPFDIKLSKNKSEYIIGYYTDLCERTLPDYSTMILRAHVLRPYFFLLYPYLHVITSDVVCERLKGAEFQKIASFKDFVF